MLVVGERICAMVEREREDETHFRAKSRTVLKIEQETNFQVD